jgi:Fe-S oxidoreductase
MEPSCLAVFRDELPKMLPHDDDAARLTAHALHFGEFFERYGLEVPFMDGDALLWGHCHQRATGGVQPDQQVLARMGLDVKPLKGGCCGLAGSWGFENGKYQISMDCGEQALLPALREAGTETVVVANGFSCQTQIGQSDTGRRALHLGEVIQLARDRNGADAATNERPEDRLRDPRPSPTRPERVRRTAIPVAAGLMAAAAAAFTGRQAIRRS